MKTDWCLKSIKTKLSKVHSRPYLNCDLLLFSRVLQLRTSLSAFSCTSKFLQNCNFPSNTYVCVFTINHQRIYPLSYQRTFAKQYITGDPHISWFHNSWYYPPFWDFDKKKQKKTLKCVFFCSNVFLSSKKFANSW